MTLNFPDSPSTGDIYDDSTSGFRYEWNGTVWISTDPARAANIKELDDISSGFNGSTTQFNLRVSSSAVEPVSDSQLLISVGGVMQNPTNDYTVSGSTITFTTAPSAGLTFFGTFLGQALSLNTVQDGTVEFASFKTGTAGVGIKSDGTAIGVGITQIDFVGSGNTVVSVGNTVSVYIAAGIDTTGTSKFNNIITTGDVTGNLNVTGIVTATTLHGTLATAAQTNITSVGTLSALTATSLTAATGVTTNATNTQLVVTGVSTYTGAIDANGGANIAGGLVANSAQVSDLTSGRVTYAGGSGELQDSGNLTFSGSELTASSATVSDLTDNRVVIAGSSGALEDSSNLTFDGSTLTVNGDVSVAGTITYQEVSEIDAVGFVTARKGVRVTNGGIIVTAGLSTFSDDVKLAGANYNITFDRSADDIIFDDNAKAIFGSGGDGLEIYHDSNNSFIKDSGTGRLSIVTSQLQVTNAADSEVMIKANNDGAAELYYNGTKRIESTSVGMNVVGTVDADSLNIAGVSTFVGDVTFDGNTAGRDAVWDRSDNALEFADNALIKMGTGADLQLYHNGSNSYVDNSTGILYLRGGDIYVTNADGSENIAAFIADSFVKLYNNGVESLRTSASGITVRGPEGGSGVIGIYADEGDDNADLWRFSASASSSELYFQNYASGSWETNLKLAGNAGVHLYYDNSAVCYTATDALRFNDSQYLKFGSSQDFILFHDGTSSYIRNTTGNLYIEAKSGETAIQIVPDGATDLRYNGTAKITTTNTGVSVTGAIVDSTHGNVRDIPATSKSSSYTLVAGDYGKVVYTSTGGVTIPNSVMSGGNVVTIINNSGSDQTITQASGLTLYNTADASTGNRTLAGRGMCTIWFQGGSTAYISGAGLS